MYFEGLLIGWYSIWSQLLCNVIEITFRHGCSPKNLLHNFRTPFPKNTSGQLILAVIIYKVVYFFEVIYFWKSLNSECLIAEIYSKYNNTINLLNGVSHFGFTILFKKWAKEKKKMTPFWEKKQKNSKIVLPQWYL